MLRPGHVKLLISDGQITESQWSLYVIATRYLEGENSRSTWVVLQFRNFKIEAFEVGLDASMPGVLLVTGPKGMMYYSAWSELVAVMLRAE